MFNKPMTGKKTASRPAGKPAGTGFVRRPFIKKKVCRFCADKNLKIDYKDSKLLRNYITERGKIIPRRVTGNCAYHQRRVARAIKLSRIISIMPFQSVNV